MKRAGVVLSILSMALLHLVCCGMPLIIALGGSIGLYFSLKEYTGWALLFHMFSVCVMLYFLYKPGMSNVKKVKVQRIVFWVFTLLTLGTYVFTHSNLFKSEEEILQQQYFERIFKPKNK